MGLELNMLLKTKPEAIWYYLWRDRAISTAASDHLHLEDIFGLLLLYGFCTLQAIKKGE